MNVKFTRTGEKRYRITVDGPGVISSYMEPAAGYDARLPHDLAHFVVENLFGIMGCIYGPLSHGGRGFAPLGEKEKRPRISSRDPKRNLNQREAEMTERIIDIACHAWTNRTYTGGTIKGISSDDIARVCRAFDVVSDQWSKLKVGESMTLEWSGSRKTKK